MTLCHSLLLFLTGITGFRISIFIKPELLMNSVPFLDYQIWKFSATFWMSLRRMSISFCFSLKCASFLFCSSFRGSEMFQPAMKRPYEIYPPPNSHYHFGTPYPGLSSFRFFSFPTFLFRIWAPSWAILFAVLLSQNFRKIINFE